MRIMARIRSIKPRSLRLKLVIPLIVVETFFFLILAWNTEFYLRRATQDAFSMGVRSMTSLIGRQWRANPAAENVPTEEQNGRALPLGDVTAEGLVGEEGLLYITIEDRQGRILLRSAPDITGVALSDGGGSSVREIAVPLESRGTSYGTIRVGFSEASISASIVAGRIGAVAVAALAVFMSGLIIWYLVRSLTRPLNELAAMAERISLGDLTHKIHISSHDEVGRLGTVFNRMAMRLEEFYSSLEEKVRERTEELSERKRELEGLVNGISDSLFLLDSHFEILTANKSASAILGLQGPKGLVGAKCYRAFFGKNHPCQGCPAAKALEEGNSAFSVFETGDRLFHLFAYPIADAEGEIEKIIVFKKDVTRERTLERELVRSARLARLGKLAACVANGIRNPLAGISGCAEVLERRGEKASVRRELLPLILSDVKKLDLVVKDFLDFAVLSNKEKSRTNVGEAVDEVLFLVAEQTRSQGILVERQDGSQEVFVEVAKEKLQQALLKIVHNALQAMPKGGKLKVKTGRSQARASIEIADTGPGVPQQLASEVFEPFYTTKHRGTGLGLSIARMIVEEQGGSLQISNNNGRGAQFGINLPLGAQVEQSSLEKSV
jgi:nitrogen fixation/metabolism regulation signal transduction histidine kinase